MSSATEVVVPEPECKRGEDAKLLRSYLELSKVFALEKYDLVKSKLPTGVADIVDQTLETGLNYTPESIKDRTVSALETLDGVLDKSDDMLITALQKLEEMPAMLEELKTKLTPEQILQLIGERKETCFSELSKYLPSKNLDDIDLKTKAQEIVEMVLAQPEVLRENRIGQTISTVAGSMYNITSGAVASISSAIGSFLAIPDWEAAEKLKNLEALEKLWGACDVVKHCMTAYTSNVNKTLAPITPGLEELILTTSIFQLPMELIKVLTEATGLSELGEAKISRDETRALFWALIDISFLMSVVDVSKPEDPKPAVDVKDAGGDMEEIEEKVETKHLEGAVDAPQKPAELVPEVQPFETIPDEEAIKGEWAKGYQEMDFS